MAQTVSSQQQLEAFGRDYQAVREQVGRVVVGHEDVVDGVLTCLFVGGHALLEGVPGLGKTLLVRSLASALHLSFSRIQFTPDLMPADITGTTIVVEHGGDAVESGGTGGGPGGGMRREFRFQPGPVFAQIVLADEINRATPKTQAAMLEAMQERSVTVGRTTHRLEQPFLVMATQNPIEQEGTYPLPEAQLDRFLFKLLVGYSSREQLHEILRRTTTGHDAEAQPVLDAARIVEMQQLVRQVVVAPHVQDYAVRAVLATHPEGEFATALAGRYVRYGASPRAAQALVLGAKVRALVEGRGHVSVDDLRAVLRPALRHRLVLNFEAHAEAVEPDTVLDDLLATLPLDAPAPAGA